MVAVLVLIPVAAILTGVYLGKSRAHSALIPQEWAQELVQYRAEISRASEQAREEVNALATILLVLSLVMVIASQLIARDKTQGTLK